MGLLQLSPEVLCQEVSGEAVLLDLKSESYFALDAAGTRIWQLIGESGSVPDVVHRMLEEFDVDADVLASDVAGFVGQLLAAGLVSRVGPEA